MNIELAFEKELEKFGPFEDKAHFAVALSGGPDSMALAFLMKKYCEHNHSKITLITIDHKLREESTKEAKEIHQYLTSHGFDHKILTWDHKKIGSNIQATAREARYKLLINYCLYNNILYLITAHQQDDQAENFLIRLTRGSGTIGLSGIKSYSSRDGVTIIRPLLNFIKDEIYNYLHKNKIFYVEDPSNKNHDFTRVKIRSLLQNGSFGIEKNILSTRIAASSRHLYEMNKIFEANLVQKIMDYIEISNFGYILLDKEIFGKLENEELYRLIHNILVVIGNPNTLRSDNLSDLITIIRKQNFSKKTLGNCEIRNIKGYLLFLKEKSSINNNFSVIEQHKLLWDNRFKINIFDDFLEKYSISLLDIREFEEIMQNKTAIIDKIPNKDILFTIPVIKHLDNLMAIPHINYYKMEDLKNVDISFLPQKTLFN